MGGLFGALSTATPAKDSGSAPTAGTSALGAHGDHSHPRERWTPADVGLLSWSFPVDVSTSTSIIATAGTLNLVRLHMPLGGSVTNVILSVTTQGSSLTSGQNFAALYTSAGALVGVTADQTTAWGSTGLKTMALASGPFTVAAGDVYVGFWANGSTLPTLTRGSNVVTGFVNGTLAAPNLRFCTADTSLTTTAPANFGTQTADKIAWWAALS